MTWSAEKAAEALIDADLECPHAPFGATVWPNECPACLASALQEARWNGRQEGYAEASGACESGWRAALDAALALARRSITLQVSVEALLLLRDRGARFAQTTECYACVAALPGSVPHPGAAHSCDKNAASPVEPRAEAPRTPDERCIRCGHAERHHAGRDVDWTACVFPMIPYDAEDTGPNPCGCPKWWGRSTSGGAQ